MKFFLTLIALVLVAGCQTSDKTLKPAATDTEKKSDIVDSSGGKNLSVMQGITGETWSRINIVREKSDPIDYEASSIEFGVIPSSQIKKTTFDYATSAWVVDELEIIGLKPGAIYTLKMTDIEKKIRDERKFKSLIETSGNKFAVVSCADDNFAAEQKIAWNSLWANNPQFILMIGDNVYTDWSKGKTTGPASVSVLWNRYIETRQALQLYKQKDLIPVVGVWDDHDFGENDGDRRFSLKSESAKIFHTFFPQGADGQNFLKGPGVSLRWNHGGETFILFDDRSFRSPNPLPVICTKKPDIDKCKGRKSSEVPDALAKSEPETHFGKEQERWALAEVRKLHRPTWLVSGDQWFGAYHPFESFEGNHPNNFKKFLKELSKSAFRIAFLSGDRHSSEITKTPKASLGYESYEIVSSPIHAKVFPSNWVEFPNANQIASTAEAMNFTIIDSRFDKKDWNIKVQNRKIDNSESFSKDLVIR